MSRRTAPLYSDEGIDPLYFHEWVSATSTQYNTILSTQPYSAKLTDQLFFNIGQVEELTNKKMKKQSGEVIPILNDKASRPFISFLFVFKISKDVVAKAISKYNEAGYLSLLGRTCDDDTSCCCSPKCS